MNRCRDHLLVLPSVVCATRVAADIAGALGEVTITHQHGCSQVGDDGVRTGAAFLQISCNPNVAAVMVVGLGCETIQGRSLAAGIGSRRRHVEFVGIQDRGGSQEAIRHGVEAGTLLLRAAMEHRGGSKPISDAVIGVEVSRPSRLAAELVERALAQGAAVVVGNSGPDRLDLPAASHQPAFGEGERSSIRASLLLGAGRGAQQHVALAAAGAHAIVSFPALDDAPVGFPICPVIAVAGASPLHAALGEDFDLGPSADVDALWARVAEVLGGAETAAEARSSSVFALERLAMSM